MFRTLSIAAMLLASLALPAAAMDCDAKFNEAQGALAKMDKLSAGQRAARMRMSLMAYDHCNVGDVDAAKRFFEMMMRSAS